MDNIAVSLRNVTKEYVLFKNNRQRFKALFNNNIKLTKVTAVNNVSFDVRRGESVAFFGRNGAGKSTILKLITSVTSPTKGDIIVNGRVSALLELTSGFSPELTGRENIYLRCQVMGMSDKEIKDIEDDVIEFADIGIYIDQPVKTYSSGMRARLGFAINSHVLPDILIVDEALSVGDQEFQAKCKKKVNEILADGKVTLLFVSHSKNTAKSFCERGIVINKGTFMYDGNIDDAIKFYDNMLVLTKKASK